MEQSCKKSCHPTKGECPLSKVSPIHSDQHSSRANNHRSTKITKAKAPAKKAATKSGSTATKKAVTKEGDDNLGDDDDDVVVEEDE